MSILGGLILGVSIYELQIRIMSSDTFKTLVAQVENSNNLFEIILLLIVVMFLSWIGIGYPLNALSNSAVNTAAMANLNYALKHGSAWDVPHKFLGSSLVYPYAWMGGASVGLALIVIILLVRENKQNENIAKINLLPVVFNSNWGLMVGMPIILNPVLFYHYYYSCGQCFISFSGNCTAYYCSMRVSSAKRDARYLNFIFGSNGDWVNLVFSILLFILDIVMLIPIASLGQRIEKGLREREQKNE